MHGAPPLLLSLHRPYSRALIHVPIHALPIHPLPIPAPPIHPSLSPIRLPHRPGRASYFSAHKYLPTYLPLTDAPTPPYVGMRQVLPRHPLYASSFPPSHSLLLPTHLRLKTHTGSVALGLFIAEGTHHHHPSLSLCPLSAQEVSTNPHPTTHSHHHLPHARNLEPPPLDPRLPLPHDLRTPLLPAPRVYLSPTS